MPSNSLDVNSEYQDLLQHVGETLEHGRAKVVEAVNTAAVTTYWEIGRDIVEYEQGGNTKAEYGSALLKKLSRDLTDLYGSGFSMSNVAKMRKLYLTYPILQTASAKLSWSHYVELLKIDDPMERSFYEKEAESEHWGVRDLKRQMKSMLFHRLALSTDREEVLRLAKEGEIIERPEDILREPYVFEFTGLPQLPVYTEGDFISLNGTDGNVYTEAIKTLAPELSGDFGQIMEWADEARTLKIRTNADNPRDAVQAVAFGAEGIGLCRTEHMFFDDERIPKIRRMILAENEEERREALAGLLPYQKEDFKGIYKAMGDRPVTIRLLDPPLHEFLPKTDEDIKQLSEQFNIPYEKVVNKTLELHEFNPMLGHRGCRLAVTYPEIAEMQTEAIIMAALEVRKEEGIDVVPEIMVPLVGHVNELKFVKETIVETADRLIAESGEEMKYMVGTMIEIPRAAVTADEIAQEAEFFSFGTNDLTQMGFGFSRDDTGSIIKEYVDKGIFDSDPFQSLDQSGIGKLVKIAVEGGKKTRPNIKLGICGEHGGDPASIKFCHEVGLNYVSCSPFRVPIARLAAAQAAIEEKRG